jgi:hypothetical protein
MAIGDVDEDAADALHLQRRGTHELEALDVVEVDGARRAAGNPHVAGDEAGGRVEAHHGLRLDDGHHPGRDDGGRRADDAMAAHRDVLVLLHDHDREVRARALRRQEQHRAHHAAAARLEVEHAAQRVVVAPEPGALVEQRRARRDRDAAHDHARRVALRVGVDGVDGAPEADGHDGTHSYQRSGSV